MKFVGSIALQDDYSATENLCNYIERFKCEECELTSEFLKSAENTTKESKKEPKTEAGFKILNKKK